MITERRRCYVEWTNKNKIRLTTAYIQKTFVLDKQDDFKQINFITLKKFDGIDDDKFFGEIRLLNGEYKIVVYCRTSPGGVEEIGTTSLSNKREFLYSVNIVVENKK